MRDTSSIWLRVCRWTHCSLRGLSWTTVRSRGSSKSPTLPEFRRIVLSQVVGPGFVPTSPEISRRNVEQWLTYQQIFLSSLRLKFLYSGKCQFSSHNWRFHHLKLNQWIQSTKARRLTTMLSSFHIFLKTIYSEKRRFLSNILFLVATSIDEHNMKNPKHHIIVEKIVKAVGVSAKMLIGIRTIII